MMAVCLSPAFAAPTVHGPGLHETPLMLDDVSDPWGLMEVYNTKGELIVDVSVNDPALLAGWSIELLHLYIEPLSKELLDIPQKKDKIFFPGFPHRWEFEQPVDSHSIAVRFEELFGKDVMAKIA